LPVTGSNFVGVQLPSVFVIAVEGSSTKLSAGLNIPSGSDIKHGGHNIFIA